MTRFLSRAAAVAALLAATAAASQTQPPVRDSTEATPSAAQPPTTPAGEEKRTSIPALEPIGRRLRALANDGVLLRATFTDELGGNLTGGIRRGHTNTGLGLVGADADLDKLVGWTGAKVHVLGVGLYGDSVAANDVGNAIKFQGSYFNPQKFQLANLSIEQDLFGGKVNILAGRINATGSFAKPTYGCQFLNGSQCPYYLVIPVAQFSTYPYVTWGGRVSVEVARNTHLSAGGFSIDPDRRNHHFGDLLHLNTTTGYTIPFQLEYGTDFATDRMPRHFTVGGWYNSATYSDPRYNAQGRSRVLYGGPARSYSGGRWGVFALADQVVFRPDRSRRNLAVFASIAAPLDGHEVFSTQGSVGLLWTGPTAARPADTIGLQASYATFTDHEVGYENDLIAKAAGRGRIDGHQVLLEANYGFEVLRGIRVTPAVEYLINPDVTALPTQVRNAPDNALVLALRLGINLGDIFGLPPALARHR